jgi:uncharacterized protein involved in outer membrane biogenesis
MLRWLIKIVLLVMVITGSLVGIVLVAEPELRLTPYRDTLSQRLSGLFGREVMLDGDIQLKLGRHAALHLTQVRLANAEWAESKTLLSAGRISAGIDLLALLSRRVHLEGIVLREIDIALEQSADGNLSWDSGDAADDSTPDAGGKPHFSVIVEDALVEQARVRFSSPHRTAPLLLAIERLSQHERDHMLMLDGRGTINQSSITLAGQIGTLDAVLAGRDIDLDLSASIDDTVMRLRGRLGDPGRLEDIDLEGGIRGPSPTELLAVFGIDDTVGGNIDTHLVIEDHDPGLKANLIGHIGAMQIDARGVVGKPTVFDDVALDVSFSGENLSILGALLGVRDLPVEPYSLKGRLQRNAGRLRITNALATSGDSKAELNAELPAFPAFDGGTANLRLQLSELRRYAIPGSGTLPPGPLLASLQVNPAADGASRLDAKLDYAGNSRVTLEGLIGAQPGYRGTRLAFTVDVPDVRQLNKVKSTGGQGPVKLQASGNVTVDDRQQVQLSLPDGRLGEMRLEATGTVGRLPSMTGADLTLKAGGASLQSFVASFSDAQLPPQPYRLEARLQGHADKLNITSMRAQVGQAHLRGEGPIGPLPELHETDTRLELDIPRISDLLPQAVDAAWAQASYQVNGQLEVRDQRIRLSDGVIKGDHIDGSLSAEIAADLGLQSARLTMQIETDALSKVMPAVDGYVPPDASMSLAVTAQPTRKGIDVRKLDIKLADATARANGSIGLGSSGEVALKFEARGPSLGQLGSFHGTRLKDEPFTLNGTVRQAGSRYSIDDLALQLGNGGLKGSIAVLAQDIPTVDIALESDGGVFSFLPDAPQTAAGDTPADAQEQPMGHSPVIPDVPIELDALARINGRLQWHAKHAGHPDPLFPGSVIVDTLDLDVRLNNGKLALEQLRVEGDRGQLALNGSIERQGTQAGMNLALQASDFRFGILAAERGLEALPGHTISVELAGIGHTYRSLASSLNGSIRIEGGSGRINNSRTNKALGRFTNDLISTLNPFAKSEPQTRIDCSAAAATVTDGVVQLYPGAVLRTDKLDILASGTINLHTEQLDIQFRSVPLKGVGISVAGVVHPYVKVGGTLSRPGTTLDAPKALLSGSAAVATGGLSILAAGLLDRVSGTTNPCAEIIAKADSGKAKSTLNPIDALGGAIHRRSAPTRPSLSKDD